MLPLVYLKFYHSVIMLNSVGCILEMWISSISLEFEGLNRMCLLCHWKIFHIGSTVVYNEPEQRCFRNPHPQWSNANSLKIDENFKNFFLKTKAKNKYGKILKYTGLVKINLWSLKSKVKTLRHFKVDYKELKIDATSHINLDLCGS